MSEARLTPGPWVAARGAPRPTLTTMTPLVASRKRAVKKMLRIAERDVTRQCVDYMALHGYTFERRNAGTADFGVRGRVSYGKPGASDGIFTHPSKPAIYAEFKASDSSLPDLQEATTLYLRNPKSKALKHDYLQAKFLQDKRNAGFIAFWANSLAMFKERSGL
jgi:hypothetical protein